MHYCSTMSANSHGFQYIDEDDDIDDNKVDNIAHYCVFNVVTSTINQNGSCQIFSSVHKNIS